MWATKTPLRNIELAGRTCYKSEDRIIATSAAKFVRMLLDRGHEAMVEHASASYRVICDRGVTHEIVRHRLFSYAQESSRYCNYKGGVTFIIPCWFPPIEQGDYCYHRVNALDLSEEYIDWLHAMLDCEAKYRHLMFKDWTPQQARSVLPNALKTEIVITGNLREWRHFFKLRCAKTAHPQMQEVANMVLADIRRRIAVIFDDIGEPKK